MAAMRENARDDMVVIASGQTGLEGCEKWENDEVFMADMVECLASAFLDDPLFMWMFGRSPRELDQTQFKAFWASIFKLHASDKFPKISSLLTVDPVTQKAVGAQLWVTEKEEKGVADLYATGITGNLYRLSGFWNLAKAVNLFDKIENEHFRIMNHVPHLYLASIGVHESGQGCGFGSGMAREVLHVADSAGLPCYLESSNPKNVPFYIRLGFEICGEYRYGKGEDQVVTFMVRPPYKGDLTHSFVDPARFEQIKHQFQTAVEAPAVSRGALHGMEEIKAAIQTQKVEPPPEPSWFDSIFS